MDGYYIKFKIHDRVHHNLYPIHGRVTGIFINEGESVWCTITKFNENDMAIYENEFLQSDLELME